jgi:hypothetical protein
VRASGKIRLERATQNKQWQWWLAKKCSLFFFKPLPKQKRLERTQLYALRGTKGLLGAFFSAQTSTAYNKKNRPKA